MASKKRRRSDKKKIKKQTGKINIVQSNISSIQDKSEIEAGRKPGLLFRLARAILIFLLAGGFSFFIWRFLIIVPVKRGSHLSVLLITLDTTRADRLGCYGYDRAETPNIDWFASHGVRFARAYAQVPLTFPSHCSILSGTYPLYHGARNNGTYHLHPDIVTLAEVLKEKGYETAAFVSSFTVDSRFGLDQGFDVYDDNFRRGQAFKPLNAERRAEEVFEPFQAWLETRSQKPFFCWLHFFDPHLPYDPPSPYKEKFASEPYDGEVAYMDFYIGQVKEKLKAMGLLSQVLVILAGDHGEGFGEKGENGHGVFLYEESLRVPLIFYAEGRLPAHKVIRARVRLIDIMPTILDMLKIPVPKGVQGKSLLPIIERKSAKDLPAYIETYFPRENYGWSELKGLIAGPWKYIQAPREELYNLKKDPEERINLAREKPGEVARLKQELKKYAEIYSSHLLAEKRQVTAEEREKLKSLGYVAMAEEVPEGNLPDPKDRIEELKMMTSAEILEFEQRFEEAASLYEKILATYPESPTSYINLALVYARLNQFDRAVEILEKGLAKRPDSLLLLSRLGHTYLVMGRLKKSLDVWQRVLNLDPNYFDALLSSGWILDLMGDKEAARKFYEKAMEIEPENKFLRQNLALNLATTGNIDGAIKIYEKLVADYPEDNEIWQDLGIAYGYAGKIKEAIDCLEKAVTLKPTATAYYNLGVAMKKIGDLEGAIKYLKLYLENSAGENLEKVRNVRAELVFLERNLRRH